MAISSWLVGHKDLIETVGVIAALLFTGVQLRRDSHARRADTLIEITSQHRDLWTYFYDNPKFARLLKDNPDLKVHPITDEEVHFVNLVLLHIRASFYARKARIYVEPECLRMDIRDFLSHPIPAKVWNQLKPYHDRKFVRFVEASLHPEQGAETNAPFES